MKTTILASVAICIIVSSCISKGDSHSTPQIGTVNYIIKNGTDTLKSGYSQQEGKYYIDTIQVGDTVRFPFGFATGFNAMNQITVGYDKDYAHVEYHLDSIPKGIITADSNPSAGIFYVASGITYLGHFNIDYIATAVHKKAELKLSLTSDSKFSPGTLTIITPIVAAPNP